MGRMLGIGIAIAVVAIAGIAAYLAIIGAGGDRAPTDENEPQGTAAPQTQTIYLHYYNPDLDIGPGGVQCSRRGIVAVERRIPRGESQLRDAINLLLQGDLTDAERAQGITTEYPLPGFTLQSARIDNGVAILRFDDPQNQTNGGACRVGVLWYQIEATALQFPNVTAVRFEPPTLFQP